MRPPISDRSTWQAKLDELRVKEKAHTRMGDALAAERRRLPMVEVDAQAPLVGTDGRVPFVDVFGAGRSSSRTSTWAARFDDAHVRAVVPALA